MAATTQHRNPTGMTLGWASEQIGYACPTISQYMSGFRPVSLPFMRGVEKSIGWKVEDQVKHTNYGQALRSVLEALYIRQKHPSASNAYQCQRCGVWVHGDDICANCGAER